MRLWCCSVISTYKFCYFHFASTLHSSWNAKHVMFSQRHTRSQKKDTKRHEMLNYWNYCLLLSRKTQSYTHTCCNFINCSIISKMQLCCSPDSRHDVAQKDSIFAVFPHVDVVAETKCQLCKFSLKHFAYAFPSRHCVRAAKYSNTTGKACCIYVGLNTC